MRIPIAIILVLLYACLSSATLLLRRQNLSSSPISITAPATFMYTQSCLPNSNCSTVFSLEMPSVAMRGKGETVSLNLLFLNATCSNASGLQACPDPNFNQATGIKLLMTDSSGQLITQVGANFTAWNNSLPNSSPNTGNWGYVKLNFETPYNIYIISPIATDGFAIDSFSYIFLITWQTSFPTWAIVLFVALGVFGIAIILGIIFYLFTRNKRPLEYQEL